MENIIIKHIPFSEYEARIKLLVLSYSTDFEKFASDSLRIILNLDKCSISLGNTSQALSMNQKILLMLDTKFFDKNDKKYIIEFMSIRNQFMHNAAAISLESCLSFLTGTETFLKKTYKNKKDANEKAGGEKASKEIADEEINNNELLSYDINDKEKLLYKCFISLAADVILAFTKTINKIHDEK